MKKLIRAAAAVSAAGALLALAPASSVATSSTPTAAQSILTAPGATNTTFATPVVVIRQGDPLNYTNLDTIAHNVTSTATTTVTDPTTGQTTTVPLFSADTEGLGGSEAVNGVQSLAPGTYSFYCSLHPWMTGEVIVK